MKKVLLIDIHKYFTVDDEDYDRVNWYPWWLSNGINNGVIRTSINSKQVTIGKFVLNYTGNLEIDHKDRNIFNNCKSNLRPATRSQNNANKTAQSNNTSGYKGVSWDKQKNKWGAAIRFKTRLIYLGRYNDILDAAKAYNKAALEYYGEFAYLNVLPESEVPVG